MIVRPWIVWELLLGTYRPNIPTYRGEGIENIYYWVETAFYSLVSTPTLVESLDQFLKHGQNGSRRMTVLEFGGERVGEKVLFCLLLVCLQSSIENILKVIGRGSC